MAPNWTYSERIKSLIGSIFINSTIHPYANLFLYIVQYLEILGLFLGRSQIQRFKSQNNNDGIFKFMLWTILFVHLGIFSMTIMVLWYGNGKNEDRNKNERIQEFDVKFQSWGHRFLRRTLAMTLTIHRRTLLIPTLTLLNILHTSLNQFPTILTLILLSLVYLKSLIIYFNKLVTRNHILSYPFVIQLESLWAMGVPLIVIVSQNDVGTLKFFGGVMGVLLIAAVWLRPVVSYQGNGIALWGCALVWGATGVELGRLMLGKGVVEAVDVSFVITYVSTSLIVGFLITRLSVYRSQTILISSSSSDTSKPLHKLTRALNSLYYPQLLFYHLINYQTDKQLMILWLLKLKKQHSDKVESTNKKKEEILFKTKSEITYQSKTKITYKDKSQIIFKTSEIITKANELIGILQQKNLQEDNVRQQFYYIVEQVMAEIYQPKHIIEENMGKQELDSNLEGVSNLFYLGAQLLLLHPRQSIRRCYSYLKSHHQLTKNTDFFSSIFAQLLIEQMDQITKQARKISNEYSLKAEQYFIFERGYQFLKQEIDQVSSLRDKFWKQSMLKETDNTKLQSLIQSSYRLQNSVRRRCQSLSRIFNSHNSPLILYSLISSYSKLVLNKAVNSKHSSFYYLYKQYNQQLEKLNKEGGEKLTQTNSKNLKKFSLLENVAACLVDLEEERGRIQWGNAWFWQEVYKKNSMAGMKMRGDCYPIVGIDGVNTESYQKENKQKQNIEDLILPQLRQVHKKYIENFTQSSSQLQVLHLKNIFLCNPHKKTISFPQIHIQLYPSLLQGLKTCCYFTNIQSKDQDNITRFSLLIDGGSWEIVGWTEGFQEWKDLLIGDESYWEEEEERGKVDGTTEALGELREVIDKMVNKRMKIHQDDIYSYKSNQKKNDLKSVQDQSENQQNLDSDQNQQNHPSSKQKPLKVLIQQQAFKISLTQLYTAPQPLFTLEFCKQSQLQQPQPTTGSMVSKVQLPVITITEESSPKEARYNEWNYSDSMGLSNNLRGFAQGKEQAEQLDGDTKKSEVNDSIEKQYGMLIGQSQKKMPRAIKLWIGATVVIVILLSVAITANIFTFSSRQKLYQTTKLSIKYLNSLITDITQLIIALRQYNYFAYINGPQDPHIPFLINQVNMQEEEVNFKLNQISGYLNQKWGAIQVAQNNSFKYVLEEDYIVIANYMLSAMTYISEIPPQEMSFPIFWSDHPQGKELSAAQVNFFQAIYNGVYVVIENLNVRKFTFLDEVLAKITDWSTKVYVYPFGAGLLLLVIFVVLSIFVEKRANRVRQNAIQLLSQVHSQQKKEKIEAIAEFRQKNNFKRPKSAEQLEEEGLTHMQKTLTTLNISHVTTKKETMFSFLIDAEKRSTNPETDRQTKRQLKGDCSATDHVLGVNDGQKTSEVEGERIMINIPKKDCSLLFYILLCTPAIAYFVTMILSGLDMDFQTAKKLEMGSEIYIKKTNIELVLLLTRRTFYYEVFIANEPQKWSSKGISFIQDVFRHSRKMDSMMQEYGGKGRLKKLMDEINYKSLCQNLANFPPSPYYQVTFNQKECRSFTNGVMLNGIKSTEVFYFESSLNLLTQIPNPKLLTKQQRYDYIQGPQLKGMKFMLGYLEVFMDMIRDAFEADLQQEIDWFIKKVEVLSGVAFVGVLALLLGVKMRWLQIRREKKFVTEIIEIISLRTIKSSSRLRDQWKRVGMEFYQ